MKKLSLIHLGGLKAGIFRGNLDVVEMEDLLDAVNELIQRRQWALLSTESHDVTLGKHKHIVRGSIYDVEEIGLNATNGPDEGKPVVVYRGEDGRLWVRDLNQFNTAGRFEKVKS